MSKMYSGRGNGRGNMKMGAESIYVLVNQRQYNWGWDVFSLEGREGGWGSLGQNSLVANEQWNIFSTETE